MFDTGGYIMYKKCIKQMEKQIAMQQFIQGNQVISAQLHILPMTMRPKASKAFRIKLCNVLCHPFS
jgi:hypothetical protein